MAFTADWLEGRCAQLEAALTFAVAQTRGLRDKCDRCESACQHTAKAYADVVSIARQVMSDD